MSALTKGQRIFVEKTQRHAKRGIEPYTVTKVGRKYFEAAPEGREGGLFSVTFRIDTWTEKTNYTSNYSAYSSERDYADTLEESELNDALWRFFYHRTRGLSLPALRRIKEIIDSEISAEESK